MNHLKEHRNTLKRLFVRAVCLVMITFTFWGGGLVSTANAVGAERATEVVNERAAAELDRVAGAGTSDQLAGTAEGAVGTMKRNLNKVGDALDTTDLSDRVDAATDELSGKVKRDVGRMKAAASELNDDVEASADNVVDAIKEFFD